MNATPSEDRSLELKDVLFVLALMASTLVLYTLRFQDRFTGDGAGLCSLFALDGTYYNVAYLPLARFLDRTLSLEGFAALRALSIVGASLGVAGSYLIARGFDIERRGALAAALLLAVSYPVAFFGTTVEVQAVHFGAAAFVACVTLFAPWRKPALAMGLVALVFPLLYWTQQTSVLLGPGWVLLVQVGRVRVARPFRWRTLLFVVGPILLAMLLLAMAIGAHWQGRTFEDVVLAPLKQVETHSIMPLPGHAWWHEWVKPLGLALPIGLVALCFARLGGWSRLALGVLLVPSIGFFLSWGVVEDGGYFLPTDLFLFVGVGWFFARVLSSRIGWGVVGVALVVQAGLAVHRISAYDQGFDVEERVRIVRETVAEEPGSAMFAAMSDYAPNIRIWMPELESIELWSLLRNQSRITGRLLEAEEVWQSFFRPYLADVFTRHDRVLLELAHRNHTGREIDPLIKELMAGVLERMSEIYDIEERPHPSWGIAIVRQRD